MRQLPDGGSLVKFNDVKWDDSLRIPPGQTMNETFDVSITLADYNTNSALLANDSGLMMGENLSKFVGVRLKEMDGLVFFDYANHYKIMLPKNWETGKN
jgi:hypothetical protein